LYSSSRLLNLTSFYEANSTIYKHKISIRKASLKIDAQTTEAPQEQNPAPQLKINTNNSEAYKKTHHEYLM
jgi:hypothetical protein